MNTEIEETEQPYIEVELDPKIAKGVAKAMQQVAGVAKLYKRYGGWFVPMPVQDRTKARHIQSKTGARQVKRTLKFMR